MDTIIHVNRQFIAMNAKDGLNRPIYTLKGPNGTRYAREIINNGPSKMVYNGKQLSCGARAWIEADWCNLELIDEMSFQEAKNSDVSEMFQ